MTCSVDGCEKPVHSRGWCGMHYNRQWAGKSMHPQPYYREPRKCGYEDCDRKHYAKGLCAKHYHRQHYKYGPRNPSTWHTNYLGYVVRSVTKNGGRTTESQHRVVMEEMLGRLLVKDENVHHINGDRADNRPSNLELWNTSQPAGQRVEDKVAWAKELLALYEPEALASGQML